MMKAYFSMHTVPRHPLMSGPVQRCARYTFAMLVLILCGACGGGDETSTVSDSGNETVDMGNVGGMSGAGGGPVEPGPCTVDPQCEDTEYCSNGECVEGCRLRADVCPGDGVAPQACDPETRQCTELIRCCPQDGACSDVLPAECPDQACESEGDCTGAQTCAESGVCTEPSVCSADDDCLNDRICDGDVCAAPCREDAACDGAEVCMAGRCVARPECITDQECTNGQRCAEGECVSECDADRPCTDGFTCNDAGLCVAESQCMMDEDCPAGRCEDGQCVVQCDADTPCPEGSQCDENNLCVDIMLCVAENCISGVCADEENCVPPCRENAQCNGSDICDEGRCIAPCMIGGCDNGAICDVDSGRCIAPMGCMDDPLVCPDGFLCGDMGVCVVAPECLSDLECAQRGLICEANECVAGCTDDDGLRPCEAGRVCDPSTIRCADADCETDMDCPADFVCGAENLCEPGCNVTGVCPGNRVCDDATGHCPELTESCQAAADCDGPRVCDCSARGDCGVDGGQCLDPCANDAQCRARDPMSSCVLETGLCERDPDACEGAEDDARCGPGRICGPQRRCVDGCRQDGDCDEGFVCLDGNQCGLEPQCRVNDDCAEGLRCDGGVCTDRCDRNADCPDSFICNVDRVCAPDLACVDDADCLVFDNDICVDFACQARCQENAECPGAQVCALGTGRCVDGCFDDLDCPGEICSPVTAQCEAPPACLLDDDGVCDVGEICVDRRCVPGCNRDPNQCDIGEVCDVATDRCVQERCDSRDDCDMGEICLNSTCAPGCAMPGGAVCPGNRQCDAATGLCPEVSVGCLRADDCDDGRVCDCLADGGVCFGDAGQCIDICSPENPCVRGVCDPNGSGFCLDIEGPCQADIECLEGSICDGGACVESCVTTGVCPGTRVCDLDTGRCPQPEQCFLDADCDGSTRCNADTNTCGAGCNGAAPCPGGQICDDEALLCRGCNDVGDCPNARWSCNDTGECIPPDGCFLPEDCPGDEVCDVQIGACIASCQVDGDCPGRQQCEPNGLCAENEAGCVLDADCIRDRVCSRGLCDEPCNGDASCPGLQTCNEITGRCEEALDAACDTEEDCIGARVCLNGRCLDQDCVTNADCANVCVDFVCQERVPTDCAGNNECGDGQTCSNFGVCVRTDDGCTEDVECPLGTPFCRNGQCVPCSIDDECGQGYACIQDRCVYSPPSPCAADVDCPFSQRCLGDDNGQLFCTPGACEGNPLAGDILVARTYTGLRLCDGATDEYLYEVPAGEGIEVVAYYDPSRGDLGLEIYDGDTSLGQVDGVHGAEALAILPAAEARILRVVVDGRVGRSQVYMLSLRVIEAGGCGPDALNGPLGNNNQSRATPVDVNQYRLNACAQEDRWFRARVPAGVSFGVETEVEDNDLELGIFAADGTLTNEAPRDGGGVDVSVDVDAESDYFVRVRNMGDQALSLDVNVSAELTVDSAAIACNSAPVLVPDVPVSLNPLIHAKRFDLDCAPDGVGETQEHIFRFRLDDESDITILVDGVFFGAVAVQSACNAADENDACGFVGLFEGNELSADYVPAGDYFLVVQSLPRQAPTVLLQTEISPP